MFAVPKTIPVEYTVDWFEHWSVAEVCDHDDLLKFCVGVGEFLTPHIRQTLRIHKIAQMAYILYLLGFIMLLGASMVLWNSPETDLRIEHAILLLVAYFLGGSLLLIPIVLLLNKKKTNSAEIVNKKLFRYWEEHITMFRDRGVGITIGSCGTYLEFAKYTNW